MASSVGTTFCDEVEDATVCAAGDQNKEPPAIFDIFAKWIDDRSLVGGAKVLEELLKPSANGNREDEKEPSFFDEVKNAFFAGDTQQPDEESFESKVWRGISSFKDMMDDSMAQFMSEWKTDKENRNDNGSGQDAAFDFFTLFQAIFSANKDNADSEESRRMASEFIQKASEFSQLLQSEKSKRGFLEMQEMIVKALGQVTDTVSRNFGHVDWHRLKPFSIIYFLEHMESLLTPSWKRRAHTFAPGVSFQEVKELHKALYLANLSYLDTIDEIKRGLQDESSEWELIYAQLTSAPGEPAHYVALRKDHGGNNKDYLDVLLVVRGTKDFSDVLSDGLLDAVEFRGGYAHAGLVKSGKFIADHHIDLLHSLLNMSKRERVKLTLIGHSLGAGAAAIAAVIFNEEEKSIDANVIGFGCPALFSRDLSESTSAYVTTIISDSDMIPRLSGPTLVNTVLDVMSYDWIENGLTDFRNGIELLRSKMPFEIPAKHTENVYEFIKKILEENIKMEMNEMAKAKRADVVLMPPGRCTLFYRDGVGVTGQKIRCDFFDSLEISRTMMDDHLIGIGYNRVLLDYMRHQIGDYQFTFDQNIV